MPVIDKSSTTSANRPQLPSIDQINFDLEKFDINRKIDKELKESLNINSKKEEAAEKNSISAHYEQTKNYIQFVTEIQNFYSLLTNNSQLENLLKNINSLKYYIDILKNLSNLSK